MTAMPQLRNPMVGRDIFSAFVSDDHSAQALSQICTDMGWSTEVIYGGGLQNAIQTLSVSSSPTILFVDLSQSQKPLSDINALAEVCEPGTVVIACGQVNDVRLYRDLIASGIQDYLLKPLHPDQLRDAFAHAQALLNEPRTESSVERQRIAIGVIGVRGGCGATSFASALSWSLAANRGRMTALLDLDLHFGTGALQLDLEPGRGLTDAIENPTRIDGLFLERSMVKASERLSVLSAEAPLAQPVISDGSGFMVLQEEVISAFDCTVVDMPRAMILYQTNLVATMTHIIVIAELTLASARDCYRLLNWLKAIAPHVQPLVVLNRTSATSTPEISRKEFESAIERKADYALPEDVKTARQAAKLGKPWTAAHPNSRLSSTVSAVANQLTTPESGDAKTAADGPTASRNKGARWYQLEWLKRKFARTGGADAMAG